MPSELFDVEVAYASVEEQWIVRIACEGGTTVRRAIELSGLLRRYPEINLSLTKVGIYGKLAKLDALVRAQDRVEIYRPLIADPKEIRRQRAEQGKPMKKGG